MTKHISNVISDISSYLGVVYEGKSIDTMYNLYKLKKIELTLFYSEHAWKGEKSQINS